MDKKIGLFVAIPVHSQVSMHTMSACLNLQEFCNFKNIPIRFCLQQDSVLTQNRNKCVADFMSTSDDFTHLLFVDSDIYFNVNGIVQMLTVDREVIAIPYPQKHINYKNMFDKIQKGEVKSEQDLIAAGHSYPVKVKDDKSILDKYGVMEISHVPTGCLLIKREVFNKMINAYPDLKVTQGTDQSYYNFFDFYHDKDTKEYFGEDFGFSRLWSKLGGQCYAYVMEEIAHVGDHNYIGKMYDNLTYKIPLDK